MSADRNTGEVLEIPVGEIAPGPLVRSERYDLDHVARLQEVIDLVPPITVRESGKGWSLIDGGHRLFANKNEGREVIRAVIVALDDAEALEAAIEANTTHGLALTATERKTAAKLLIDTTKFGDQRIASICGIGAKTVSDLRPKCSGPDLNTRTGTDGKDYPSPAVAAAQRRRAEEAFAADPTLSVRALAKASGCSIGTAQDIIAKHKAGRQETPAPPADPIDPAASSAGAGQASGSGGDSPNAAKPLAAAPPLPDGAPAVGEVIEHWPSPGSWKSAEGATSSNGAREFARFMDRRVVRPDETPEAVAAACPGQLRESARSCAKAQAAYWSALATALDMPTQLASVEG